MNNLKKKKPLRDVLIIAGVTLVLIILLDMALRIFFINYDDRSDNRAAADAYTDRSWAESYFEELSKSAVMRWEPFAYWRRKAFSGDHINVDETGTRATWQPESSSDDPLSIYVFGGSTLWGTGADDDYTIPSYLAKLLEEKDISANVQNHGETGYVSSQNLIYLIRLLQQGHRPDVVIFYDGVNDVFASLQNGSAGVASNEYNRYSEFNLMLDQGRLYRTAAERFVRGGLIRFAAGIGLIEAEIPESTEQLERDISSYYLKTLKSTQALGEKFEFEAYFFWQPSIYQKPVLSDYEQSQYEALEWFSRPYANVTGKVFDRSENLPLWDISGVFAEVEEPVFIDFCHLSAQGNAMVAVEIFDHIFKNGDAAGKPGAVNNRD